MKKILLVLPLFLLLSVPSHSKEKVYKTYTDIDELDRGKNNQTNSYNGRNI